MQMTVVLPSAHWRRRPLRRTDRVWAQVTLTTGPAPADGASTVLPVSYEKFTSMVQPGDTVFLGRYLVTGSEDSSLYLTVRRPPPRLLSAAVHSAWETLLWTYTFARHWQSWPGMLVYVRMQAG